MDQEVNLAKSSNQRMVQSGDKHIRGAILSKPTFIRLFVDRISSDEGPFVSEIKVNFHQLGVLILVVNHSTGPM